MPDRYRSKVVAAMLAVSAGFAGMHRWYLGNRWWFVYPFVALPAMGLALRADPWYRHPGFVIASLVVVASMLEAIVFSLAPDETWDARHNSGSKRRARTGWASVLLAILAMMLGATLLLSVMAIAFESWFLAAAST